MAELAGDPEEAGAPHREDAPRDGFDGCPEVLGDIHPESPEASVEEAGRAHDGREDDEDPDDDGDGGPDGTTNGFFEKTHCEPSGCPPIPSAGLVVVGVD